MKSVFLAQCMLVIVVFVVTFVAASPPLPSPGDSEDSLAPNCRTPKCPEEKNAEGELTTVNLPYPLDCLQYVSCKGSKATVVACPPDLFFDKRAGVCAPKEIANCVPCYQQAP